MPLLVGVAARKASWDVESTKHRSGVDSRGRPTEAAHGAALKLGRPCRSAVAQPPSTWTPEMQTWTGTQPVFVGVVSRGLSLTPPAAGMAMISLEDLEGLDDDEQLDDDITDNPEPMDEDDRLLSHWQAVASTHQVSVPPEMTGPIHEMTRNSQQREPLPFSAISRHEKMGEVLYEERVYPAGNWACVTTGEHLYEQSISMGFMKLMRFICKENSVGRYLGMTIPIVSHIHLMEDKNTFEKSVETAFFLPTEFQTTPPRPSDSDIRIVHRDPIRVVARTFFGTTTEETVSQQVRLLWEILGVTEELHRDNYMVAVYENPGVPRRRNEIWFIRQL